jgi:hypothetical protein
VAIIAFASAKASPGVTTSVAALAATWPAERGLVVAELDPAGGDLVVRLDLAVEPGLVTLAAAGRRELGPDTLMAHTQAFPAVVEVETAARQVLVGPVSADQASASLAALRGALAPSLAQLGADVLVDCGRLDPGSAAHDVVLAADLVVLVARPVVAEVHHLAARVPAVNAASVALVLVGDRPYPVSEVAATVGLTPLGTLPLDARAAAAFGGGLPAAVRHLRRSQLLRDARAMSEVLAGWLEAGGAATAAPAGQVAPIPSVPPPPAAPAGPPPASHRGAPGPGTSGGPAAGPPPPPPPPLPEAPSGPPAPPEPSYQTSAPPEPSYQTSAPPEPSYQTPAPPEPSYGPPAPALSPLVAPPADPGHWAPPAPQPAQAPVRGGRSSGRGGPKHFRRDPVEETRR